MSKYIIPHNEPNNPMHHEWYTLVHFIHMFVIAHSPRKFYYRYSIWYIYLNMNNGTFWQQFKEPFHVIAVTCLPQYWPCTIKYEYAFDKMRVHWKLGVKMTVTL